MTPTLFTSSTPQYPIWTVSVSESSSFVHFHLDKEIPTLRFEQRLCPFFEALDRLSSASLDGWDFSLEVISENLVDFEEIRVNNDPRSFFCTNPRALELLKSIQNTVFKVLKPSYQLLLEMRKHNPRFQWDHTVRIHTLWLEKGPTIAKNIPLYHLKYNSNAFNEGLVRSVSLLTSQGYVVHLKKDQIIDKNRIQKVDGALIARGSNAIATRAILVSEKENSFHVQTVATIKRNERTAQAISRAWESGLVPEDLSLAPPPLAQYNYGPKKQTPRRLFLDALYLGDVTEYPKFGPTITPNHFWTWILWGARALDVLHKNNVVHGDFKIDNILVPHTLDRAVLSDFDSLTPSGERSYQPLVGTEDYMAPEVYKQVSEVIRLLNMGIPITEDKHPQLFPSSDVYSLGMMIQLLFAIESSSDPLKESIRNLTQRCTHLEPKQRPPVAEVIVKLKELYLEKFGCEFHFPDGYAEERFAVINKMFGLNLTTTIEIND